MKPPASHLLTEQTRLILSSYRRLFGRDLIDCAHPDREVDELFSAPFVVLSALGPFGSDHVFNYANRRALELFEYEWDELIGKPSSASAEPVHREERRRLLDAVGRHGFIHDYSGIRISRNGRRFRIVNATVFNLVDPAGNYVGQSATFASWEHL